MFVGWNRQRSWISLWKRLQRLRTSLRALRTRLRPRIRPLRVVQAAGKPSHQSHRQRTLPKSNAPTASQRNVEGADASAATRGLRHWRQDEEEKRAKHHSSLASQASCFGAGGVSRERSWAGNPALHARSRRRRFDLLASGGGAPSAALFYRRPYRFSRRFFSSSCSAVELNASQRVYST